MFVSSISGNQDDKILEYTLSTGFDVSTASYVDSLDISSRNTQPTGLAFNNDGTKMFVVDGHTGADDDVVEE